MGLREIALQAVEYKNPVVLFTGGRIMVFSVDDLPDCEMVDITRHCYATLRENDVTILKYSKRSSKQPGRYIKICPYRDLGYWAFTVCVKIERDFRGEFCRFGGVV